MQALHPYRMHLCTPIPSEMLTFELSTDNMLEGLLLFSLEDTVSVISNTNVKSGLVWS